MASSTSLYSTFATSPDRRSSNASTMVSESDSLLPSTMGSTHTPLAHSPNFARFLSDFTLGFSDGLTVPFALTAGLSSLGSTDTVITAGLAELVAGSISMGIGGYLAALDELPNPSAASETSVEEGKAEERRRKLLTRSKSGKGGKSKLSEEEEDQLLQSLNEEKILQHLQPLALSEEATSAILSDLRRQPSGVLRAALRLENQASSEAEESTTTIVNPYTSGLSISLGYVVGGIIPLIPYFFLAEVGAALQWSIGLCLLALYLFGFGKCWFFKGEGTTWKRCVYEGMQMMILGGCAAASAIVCVELLDRSD